ncbi:MAG: tetratricopeptide repeat protein, partial [Anaerolineae bacterium]|nr:tetratricopeptide repeat protein [Anaerolineae bacterium]
SLPTLLRLVHQSWLQQRDDGRYQLHEVLRQYGKERLQADQQECQQTRDRHAEYFAEYLHQHAQALQTSSQRQALDALILDIDSNIPEALDHLVATQKFDTIVEKMLTGLLHYSLIRGSTEDIIPVLRAAHQSITPRDNGKALIQAAILETAEIYFTLNRTDTTGNLNQRTHRLLELVNEAGIHAQMGMWYTVLVSLYGFNVNFEEGSMQYLRIMQGIDEATNTWEAGYGYLDASQFCGVENRELRQSYLEKALTAFKGIGVLHEQGVTLLDLGMLAAMEMDYSRAIEYTLQAQGYFEKVQNQWGVDRTWMNLADFYIYSGKIEQGIHAFDETRRFNEKSGNRHALGIDLSWESMAVSRFGKLEDALELRRRSLEVALEVGNPHDIAWHTWELGEIYRLMHELQQARQCYDEALSQFEALNDMLGLAFYERGYGDLAIMRQDWSEARLRFIKALEYQEQELRPFRGWGLIYFHSRLSTALVRLGDHQAAAQQLNEALKLVNSWPYPDMMAMILAGIAEYLAAGGEATQAIEIATCVMEQPTTWNEVKNQARLPLRSWLTAYRKVSTRKRSNAALLSNPTSSSSAI